MASIPFIKAHGVGNDFLLVEEPALSGITRETLAVRICDRHTGVGADGLVVLARADGVDATFRIFNADGSEATISGNALRCAGAWLVRERGAPAELTVETRIGRRTLHFLRREGNAGIFRTEIGKPSFSAADVPFAPPDPVAEPIRDFPMPIGGSAVAATIFNMGNAQCIVFVEQWNAVDWKNLGRMLERHSYFPDRANVGFVRVLDGRTIEARFWERGAGYTLASGTGSCGCAIASHLAGKCGRDVTVRLERGELQVCWREDGMVELTGPAEIVAEGRFMV
jgi:diaminopimelate epimerase